MHIEGKSTPLTSYEGASRRNKKLAKHVLSMWAHGVSICELLVHMFELLLLLLLDTMQHAKHVQVRCILK